MTTAQQVETEIEAVAETAAGAVEAAENRADAAIEAAEERVEDAEAAAAAIAEAAVLSELGTLVRSCNERAEKWHDEQQNETASIRVMLQDLQTEMATLRTMVSTTTAPVVAVVETATPSSIPEALDEATKTVVAVANPATASAPDVRIPVEPRKRSTRWI